MYEYALREIHAGRKQTHWMWFIFPQLRGLGSSHTADFFGISGEAEARAYLDHPVLRQRLEACCDALLTHTNLPARAIFGHPDDLKLHSSVTLFACVAEPGSVFAEVIDHFFDGKPDDRTLAMLRAEGEPTNEGG